MPIRTSQALLAALALVAAPAFAQDAAPAPAQAETATEQPAPPATDEAEAETVGETADDTTAGETQPSEPVAPATDEATAEAASDEPAVGSYYVKSTVQDWTLRCIRSDRGKDPCELYQLMKDGEGNSVAEMTLIPLTNGNVAAGATLVAPLETDLIEGLGFAVDSGKVQGYPFSFCAPVGCVSRMGFTAAELQAMKRGNRATVTLNPFGGNPEQPVKLDLSLAGFTAAFDALNAYADEPEPQETPADAPAEDAPASE